MSQMKSNQDVRMQKPDDKVRTSSLPLLLVKGYPVDLNKMTLIELQNFIPFLLKCATGRETGSRTKPNWWTKNIPFPCPLLHLLPGSPTEQAHALRELVFSCYKYHSCDYLLNLSSRMAMNQMGRLILRDNCDNTSSLIDSKSGHVHVTFRNENRDYDKNRPRSSSETVASPTKSCLLTLIHSCMFCGNRFKSMLSFQDHLHHCQSKRLYTARNSMEYSRPDTPDYSDECIDEDTFLQKVELTRDASVELAKKAALTGLKPSCYMDPEMFEDVPISSFLGQKMASLPGGPIIDINSLLLSISRYDKNCAAAANTRMSCLRDRGTVHRVLISYKKPTKYVHAHEYCFNAAQKDRKRRNIQRDREELRRIIEKTTKLKVEVQPLNSDQIDFWTTPKPSANQNAEVNAADASRRRGECFLVNNNNEIYRANGKTAAFDDALQLYSINDKLMDIDGAVVIDLCSDDDDNDTASPKVSPILVKKEKGEHTRNKTDKESACIYEIVSDRASLEEELFQNLREERRVIFGDGLGIT